MVRDEQQTKAGGNFPPKFWSDVNVDDDVGKGFVPLRSDEEARESSVPPYFPPGSHVPVEGDSNWQDSMSVRALHGIRVEGRKIPPPSLAFSSCGLKEYVLTQLEKQGCRVPTPIQMQVLPCVLMGRDVMIRAETGSGKTLAYLLPLLCKLDLQMANHKAGDNPISLIIVPTRELVDQIYSQLIRLIPPNESEKTLCFPVPNHDGSAHGNLPHNSSNPSHLTLSNQNPPPVHPIYPSPVPYTPSQHSNFSSSHGASLHAPPPHFSESNNPSLPHSFSTPPNNVFESSGYGHGYNTPMQSQSANSVSSFQSPTTILYIQNQQLSENAQTFNRQMEVQNPHYFHQNPSSHPSLSPSPYDSFTSRSPYPPPMQTHYSYPHSLPLPSRPPLPPPSPLPPPAPPPPPPPHPPRHPPPVSPPVPESSQKGIDITEAKSKEGFVLEYRRERGKRVLGVVGGVPIGKQIKACKEGIDVLIGTPGRLLDLLGRGVLSLVHVAYLVLDEVDRMLGEGMEEQLRNILSHVSEKDRQTILVSATLPIALENLAMSALVDPIHVTAGESGGFVDSVQHEVIFLHTYKKKATLLEVLRTTERPPVIIFCNSSVTVDGVVSVLRKEQFHVAGIHSHKSQPFRFRCMRVFREGKLDVLVSTDLVSRGIDVTDVTRVINYDLPDSIESYIHRCGRTGRSGKEGIATSFLTLDCSIAKDLRQLLQYCGQPIPSELHNLRQFGGRVIKTELGDMSLTSGKFSTD